MARPWDVLYLRPRLASIQSPTGRVSSDQQAEPAGQLGYLAEPSNQSVIGGAK